MPSSIKFTPTSYEQLSTYIGLLNTKTSEMKVAETDFKFDDSIDGKPGKGTSKIEDALYAAIVFGENKKAVMDGLYYYKRCILANESNRESYREGYRTLRNTAEMAFKVTDSEFDEISLKAHFDYFLEDNEYGKRLAENGLTDVVEIVTKEYVAGNEKTKQITRRILLNKAKEIASKVPMPTETARDFTNFIGVLVDNQLLEAVLIVFKKAVASDPSYKTVSIASAQN